MQDTWHPTEHWKIELGVRSNYYSSGKYLRFFPRGMIEYKPTSYLQFQGAMGIYQQFISLSETNSISGLNIWQSTSKGVASMSGKQYLLGIKAEPLNTFSFDVESYYRNMLHLFELNPMIPDYLISIYFSLVKDMSVKSFFSV